MKKLLVLPALALTACTGPDALIDMLEGQYRGPDATVAEPGPGDMMTDTRLRVNAPALGKHVVYWEVRTDDKDSAYRQILTVISPAREGFVQKSWRLNENFSWPNKVTADTFATITPDDVQPVLPDGCDSFWRKTEAGWAAYLDPDNCRVYSKRRDMWRRIEAETIVSAEGLRQTERGFTDDGEQLFGTPPGEYHILDRL